MQFTMAPMNLCLPGKPVDVLHTGTWTAKAIGELKKGILHNIAASDGSARNSRACRVAEEIKLSAGRFLHPLVHQQHHRRHAVARRSRAPHAPLVADMSSDIASRPIDVSKFGLIFAGAQKNLGPTGATVVIVRKDLAERADKNLPTLLQYRTHIKEKSLYHTPPTFAIYILGLVTEWIASEGGVAGIQKRNEAKAKLLYDTIDNSGGYYHCPVEKASRSLMNVVFRVAAAPRLTATKPWKRNSRKQATAAGLDRHARPSLGRRHAHLALQRRWTQDAVQALA